MMKLIKTLSLLLLISTAGFTQKEAPSTDKPLFFIKGGIVIQDVPAPPFIKNAGFSVEGTSV